MVREAEKNDLRNLLHICMKTDCDRTMRLLYQMMLLTGSKKQSTLNFYEKAGYNSTDKTAFIQWLE